MIQANELRIGNKLHFIVMLKKSDEREEVVTVTEIKKSGILCDYNKVDMMFENGAEDLVPIHLTPEILEKCGWGDSSGNNDKSEYCQNVVTPIMTYEFWHNKLRIDADKGSDDLLISVKHLHQLQNLYFALTQTEINIEL